LIVLGGVWMTATTTLLVKIIFDWLKNKKNGGNGDVIGQGGRRPVVCAMDVSGITKTVGEINQSVNDNKVTMERLEGRINIGVDAAQQDITLYAKLQETGNSNLVVQKDILKEIKLLNVSLKEDKTSAMLGVLEDISESLKK